MGKQPTLTLEQPDSIWGYRFEADEGTVEAMIVGMDMIEDEVWVDGKMGGKRRHLTLETVPSPTHILNGVLLSPVHSTHVHIELTRMVRPDEYEDMEAGLVDVLEDDPRDYCATCGAVLGEHPTQVGSGSPAVGYLREEKGLDTGANKAPYAVCDNCYGETVDYFCSGEARRTGDYKGQ